ncbi:MAG: efflux RND transporter periplasmic adaptor subunit [Bacteroidales bacterium]|nr:efflux RND transporter periplasmic adaptor subunit [Bacteroidales bacterium]
MKLNLIIIGFIATTTLLISCQSEEKANDENIAAKQKEEQKIYPVKIQKVEYVNFDKYEEYTATINAWEEVHLGPNQPNQIEKIFVEVGDRVKKGDCLVEMNASSLIQAKIQFEDKKRDFQRMDTLLIHGSASQQSYDKAKMAYELAKTNLETMQENLNIITPFNGVITGKYFNEEEIYSSMAPNPSTGVPCIVSLMQINQLKVMINISERYWPIIKKGMSASLNSEIYPDESFSGKVYRIYPIIDPSTKTFKVEIKVPNNEEKLRPGMFAKISLNFGQTRSIIIPSSVVLKQQGTNERYVFIEENGKAKRILVQLGKRFNENIEIINGLNIGDQLIITGQASLMTGTPVNIVD